MTKLAYKEQLLHPNWQRKRLETLKDAAWTCEICEATEVTLHVHHRRYIKGRMVWEYDRDELQVLCADCHAAEHAARATLDRVLQAAHYIGYGGTRKPELVAAALLAGYTRQCVGGEIDDEAYQAAGEGEQGLVFLGAVAAALGLMTEKHRALLLPLLETIFQDIGLARDGPVGQAMDAWRGKAD